MKDFLLVEQSVIGGLMLDSEKKYDVLALLNAKDFGEYRHELYFKAIASLIDKNQAVDVLTVCDELQVQGITPDLHYLAEIAKNTPSTANIDSYARAVKDCSTERRLLALADQIASTVHGDGRTLEKVERINQLVSTVNRDSGGEVREASEIMKSLLATWEQRSEMDGSLMGYSTGFKAFDARTMGLQAPDLIVIAASSGRGKTTLAMNMVQSVAIEQKKPVLVFSLEMSGEQLMDRMTAAVGRIPLGQIKNGTVFGGDNSHAVIPAVQKIKDSNLHVDDRGGLSIGQIQATTRKFFKKHGSGLLVVDYIGLVGGKGINKQEQIASVSGALKSLAKELSIPVVSLAQLNRNNTQRAEKRPVASDLRDSAAIEHDADWLVMLYEDELNEPGVMEAITVKLRNGEPGTDRLVKRLDINRFEDIGRDYVAPEPDKVAGFNY